MNLKNIRLVGVDLDGTLLTDDKKIDSETRLAIKRAKQHGVEVVPVTGRPTSGLNKQVLAVDEFTYAITNNGANIENLKEHRSIYKRQITNENAVKVIEAVKPEGLIYEYFSNGYAYITRKNLDYYIKIHENSPIGEYIAESRIAVENPFETLKEKRLSCDEILIRYDKAEQKDRIVERIKGIRGIQFWTFADEFLEITHNEADKGRALLALADILNISHENTMAFGDGENDLTMLKSAGVSVAMENAVEIIKNSATAITGGNNNGGVAKMINKIFE